MLRKISVFLGIKKHQNVTKQLRKGWEKCYKKCAGVKKKININIFFYRRQKKIENQYILGENENM